MKKDWRKELADALRANRSRQGHGHGTKYWMSAVKVVEDFARRNQDVDIDEKPECKHSYETLFKRRAYIDFLNCHPFYGVVARRICKHCNHQADIVIL